MVKEVVKIDYKDYLPPGSILSPRNQGIKNTEYSEWSRQMVAIWWYNNLQNKQHFYDVFRIRLLYEAKRISQLARIIDGYTDGVKGVIEKMRDVMVKKITVKALFGENTRIPKIICYSVMMATIYEVMQKIPSDIYDAPKDPAMSLPYFWKPKYGIDGSIQIPDNLNEPNIRSRSYTGGSGNKMMVNWWYQPKSYWIERKKYITSQNYFANPPLGSMVIFLTPKKIRFNLIVNTTIKGKEISHWSWQGIDLFYNDHLMTKKLSITEWISGIIGEQRGEFGDWYSSDPFWSSNTSGFSGDGNFIIAFLNTDKSFSSHFINWPISSPFT